MNNAKMALSPTALKRGFENSGVIKDRLKDRYRHKVQSLHKPVVLSNAAVAYSCARTWS
jgi:hypothetical protein